MSNHTYIPDPRLSRFRNQVLAAITEETTPDEVAGKIGCERKRVQSTMWNLARSGHLTRPYRGTYAPKETAA